MRDAERATIEDMVLKVDDKHLIDHIHLSVRQWLSQPLVEREEYLNIPQTTQESPRIKHLPVILNRYQVRLTHQIIRKDYPHLKTLGRDGFVRITIRNEKEDAEEKLWQDRYREQDVIQSIEFRWLIEALCGGDISKIPERCFLAAMPGDVKPNDDDVPYKLFVDDLQHKLSTRRRVLFGHNCFTDMAMLYACFIGDLPEKIEGFQELIHGIFPAVVDTKYLASLVRQLRFNSNLEALEKELRAEEVPIIEVPAAFDRYVWGELYHEAGFDSFMTAKIAIKLSAKLAREEKLREPRKPLMIVKAGETILMDPTVDTEDEEQTDEYVTASESPAETDSIMSALASKLSAVFSAPDVATHDISEPFAGRKLLDTERPEQLDLHQDGKDVNAVGEMQHEAEREPTRQPNHDTTPRNGNIASDTSTTNTPVVAVKEKTIDWQSPVEVKGIKNALAHHNLFDFLDTPVGAITDRSGSAEHIDATKSAPEENEDGKDPGADLLIWSDKEEESDDDVDGESGDAAAQGAPIKAEKPETPMTAKELEEKINNMSAKGKMMPRWESESGIWKMIGNRLVVNASAEGVCIL